MPTGRSRSVNVVGVVIDGDVMRGVHLRGVMGRISVAGCAEIEIASDVSEQGRISDATKLGEALAELWRVGRFRTRQLSFGLDGRDATFRRLTLPAGVGDDIDTAARYELDDFLPYDLEEAVTHVHEVGRDEAGVDVIAVAVRRANVERIAEAATLAKLRVRDVTLSSTVLGLGVAEGSEQHREETVVSVDGVSTTIVVRREGRATVTRVLTGGGGERSSQMADEIEQALASVEEFRRGGHVEIGREDGQGRRFRTVVDEVAAALRFEESQQAPGSERGGVVLGGAYGAHPALFDLMTDGVDVPVRVVEAPAWWRRDEPWSTFMTAAGVALAAFDRQPGIVHLDPPSVVIRRAVQRETLAGVAIAFLAAVPAFRLVESARSGAESADGEAVAAEFEADLLAERMVGLEDLALLQEDLLDRQRAEEEAVAGEIWWPRLLDEVSGALPDDTFLTSLSLRRPSADVAVDEASPTAIFGAIALDQGGVARSLELLADLDAIDDVWLVQSTASVYGDAELPVVAFVAEGHLTAAAASPRARGLTGEEPS